MKRLYRYTMLDPLEYSNLPAGHVEYRVMKDELGGIWGEVVYERPLTGDEVDHCNLDGPIAVWW